MLTDGIFDYKYCEIPGKYGKPINIIFLGDEHWNSPGFARQKWEADCDYLRRLTRQSDTYFVKTGDVFEALSTSERHTFASGNLHDSNRTRWEKEYAREIGEYVKQADFQINRTLAVYGGNHYFKFYDGTTSDMALANKLKAPYIGVCGYVILGITIDKHHTHVVKIFVHHGRPSGRKAGSAFTSLEEAASYFTDADIIVMGHDHKAGAIQLPAVEMKMGMGGHWKVKEKNRIIGRSGSYLKAYEPGSPSYAVDAMYRPSTLGFLQVILTPMKKAYGKASGGKWVKRSTVEDRWVDIKAVI